jgi:hypothetical protein
MHSHPLLVRYRLQWAQVLGTHPTRSRITRTVLFLQVRGDNMNLEQLQIILFDLYDLRYTLSQQTKDEIIGLEVTIGEHLNNIIESVEALETEVTS